VSRTGGGPLIEVGGVNIKADFVGEVVKVDGSAVVYGYSEDPDAARRVASFAYTNVALIDKDVVMPRLLQNVVYKVFLFDALAHRGEFHFVSNEILEFPGIEENGNVLQCDVEQTSDGYPEQDSAKCDSKQAVSPAS
jgi:hypothetical protein